MSKSKKLIHELSSTPNCFSEENFIVVYEYIRNKLESANDVVYNYYDYEIHLIDSTTIAFKKNNYTYSIVNLHKGISSLAKRYEDNARILKETNAMFCDILSTAK